MSLLCFKRWNVQGVRCENNKKGQKTVSSGYDERKESWKIYEQNIQEYIPKSYVDLELEDARGELSERQLQCILRIYYICYRDKSVKYDIKNYFLSSFAIIFLYSCTSLMEFSINCIAA